MIRLGAEQATIFLGEPAQPVSPFIGPGTSAEWQLMRPIPVEEHENREAPPYPFLTALGHGSDGDLILLRLDRVGALLLDGEPEDVVAVACAMALELVTSPWATGITVDLIGHAIDGADHHESVDALLTRLADTTDAGPHAVFVPEPLTSAEVDRLATSDAAAGIVAIVTGQDPSVRIPGAWELDLRRDPTPVDQLNVDVALQRLTAEEMAAVAKPVNAEPPETVAHPVPKQRDCSETPAETVPRPSQPELRLLGPVSLRGVDYARVEGKKINRLTELAAFLALNPGARAEEISQQLGTSNQPWSAATRQGYVSRLRTWLGHDQDGDLYLPNIDAKNSGYRLSGALLCDWFSFQSLVQAAHGEDRLRRLQEALDLVEGIPLSNVPHGRYEWGSWYERDMTDQIVDVAHTLAADDPTRLPDRQRPRIRVVSLCVPIHECGARLRAATELLA
ncbi:hypothetical protein [Amycolatopsis silviterrae]|uniref:Bacterial transcriptional activator domain-containing protein n=1 Tax=Amycolatopsis silviterrae TaxID=1656914 RepID=A0ABW5HNG7_9PSEU